MQPTTEWDDILTKFGIKSSKQTDKQQEQEKQIEAKLEGVDELDFDEDDEAVFQRFRDQRLSELKAFTLKPTYGEIQEIAGQDFVQEVNKAGDGVWVVLHLYKSG